MCYPKQQTCRNTDPIKSMLDTLIHYEQSLHYATFKIDGQEKTENYSNQVKHILVIVTWVVTSTSRGKNEKINSLIYSAHSDWSDPS